MKRLIRRITAAVLTALILAGSLIPAATAAAAMPAGYSEQQVEASIPKAEKLVAALLAMNPQTADLSSAVYGALYADQTLNALFSGIYSGFSENESTLQNIGVDISVPRLASALRGYPGVFAVLNGRRTWAETLPLVSSMRWNVTSRAGFAAAVSAMLSPLNPLLYTLLCSGTYTVNALVKVNGADGYQNAVAPLLQRIGCPNVMTQAAFTAAAGQDQSSMVKNICNMLFAAIDSILKTPVASLCTYLPAVAWFLKNDGIKNTLKTLMEPLQIKLAVFSLSGVSDLLENSETFSSSADLTALLRQADLSAVTGGAKLNLPEIDLDALAACGSESGGKFTANRAEAFILLLTWAVNAVKLNASALSASGMDVQALSGVLNQSTDAIVLLILNILNLSSAPAVLNYTWSYPAYTQGGASFTPNLTRENYEKVLREIDPTLNEFLLEFTDKGTLTSLVKSAVYSNKTVTALVKTLYGALDTEATASLGSLLGLSVTPTGVAASIRSKFPAAARAVGAVSAWDKLNEASVSWGFADGSKEGFVNTLIALLRPFAPYLRFLLAEGSVTFMNALTVPGGNGYETAVIPILEGIGCDPETIVPYAAYKAGGDEALITGILTPVTSLLDGVCETPVASICGLLPNLLYFLDSGAIKQCVTNLTYPVQALTEKLGLQNLLPADLTASMQTDLDLSEMLGSLTAGSDLGFELPPPDLALVKSLGTAESRASKRGVSAEYTYIAADRPLVLVTLLRYVLGAVKSSGNPNALSDLMGGGEETAEGAPDMMAMYTEKVGAQLAEMSVDETIEWLYDLLFSETPKREETQEEEFIPTVIYKKQKDYKTVLRIALAVLAVALAVGAVVFFVKFDFHDFAEKRRRKKLKAARQAEALLSAHAGKVPASYSAGSGTPPPGAPQTGVSAAEKKAMKKRLRQQEKSAKIAYRETKKADKHYSGAGNNARRGR